MTINRVSHSVRMVRARTARWALAAILIAAVASAATPSMALALGYRPVVSQVYGGGTSAGDTYDFDYIELHNPAPLDVSVEGWSVQYASRTGDFNAKTDLHGVIPAGGYLLVQEGGSGTALPVTPDIVGVIAMHNQSAKIALVRNTSLIGSIFTAATVVDFVGYGDEATFWEGPAASYVANLSPTKAAVRKADGNTDTDNNAADFDAVSAPGFVPRNRASAPHALAGPMDVTLSVTSFVGSQPAGTALGTLSTTDPARTGPFAYSLVSGSGDTDNALFSITGDALSAAAALDPAVKSTYSIRVRSTDPAWLGYERILTITVRARTDETSGGSSNTTTTPSLPNTGFPPRSGDPTHGPTWLAVLLAAAVGALVHMRASAWS